MWQFSAPLGHAGEQIVLTLAEETLAAERRQKNEVEPFIERCLLTTGHLTCDLINTTLWLA